jgi:predicted protein tyrosine phosphatase
MTLPQEKKWRFKVTDRESVERGLRLRSAYALVSIRDPDRPKVKVGKSTMMKAVLALAFHDAEPSPGFLLPGNIRLMSFEDAKAIWTFVLGLPSEVETVVVHCEQGMSRSPAVAAGLCQGMGGDPAKFFQEYQPNAYVLELVTQAARAKP